MSHVYDTLIIGGGPAGYTAALYATRAGMDTAILERMSPGGQMALTDIIDNYPGFPEGVDGITLGMNMQMQAERFGAQTIYEDVVSVDFADPSVKTVRTTDNTYLARTVILATGANPRELGLEKERALTGKGVHYCAHCDGRFYKGKTVAVVGGGNSAVSDALYLSRVTEKVYVIHRRDSLRATKIYHEPLMKAENVEFVWNSEVTEILSDGRVTGVKVQNLKDGTERAIPFSGLFVSIGRSPATDFLQGCVELDEYGYIVADESTRTSIPGVFAVGDVRTKALRQVVTAVADGATAIHYAEEYLAELH